MDTNNPKRTTKSKNKTENEEIVPVFTTFEIPKNKKAPEKAELLFMEAMVNYLLGRDINRGIQLFEKFISYQEPALIETYHKMGICTPAGKIENIHIEKILGLSSIDGAIRLLQEAIEADPAYTDAYYNLAICYSETLQVDRAIELFRKVLELDNNTNSDINESSRFNLGNQLVLRRKYQEAVEQFELILENNPKSLDALYNAAYVNFKYLQEYDKAIEYFDRILKLFNLHLDAWFNLGLCHYLKGDKEKAIEVWERLVQVYPDYAQAYYNLAITSNELGKNHKAMLFYKKYLDVPVKDPSQYHYVKFAKRRLIRLQEEGSNPEVNG
jgi:tetratricopeptide (TPR) repeat protein